MYYKYMGGVDLADMKRKLYSCSRRLMKRWFRLFYYLVDITVVNSHVIISETPNVAAISIQCTLQMWDPLCSYFRSHCDVEKAGKVRTICQILNDPLTKPWLCFLLNTLAVFDKYKTFFQTSSTATVHKLHDESVRLLKTVLSFFINPQVLRTHSNDLTEIDFTITSNQLPPEELFLGEDTTAIIEVLIEEGVPVATFYKQVVQFYVAFVSKLLKKFDFKSKFLKMMSFLDPLQCQKLPFSTFDLIDSTTSISYDKAATKLEYREFTSDSDICVPTEEGDCKCNSILVGNSEYEVTNGCT